MIKKASDLKPGDLVLFGSYRGVFLCAVERLTKMRVYVQKEESARVEGVRLSGALSRAGWSQRYFDRRPYRANEDRDVIVTDEMTARKAMEKFEEMSHQVEALEKELEQATMARREAVRKIFE